MNCELYIPRTLQERTRLRLQIASFVADKALMPPVALHMLHALADEFVSLHAEEGVSADWHNWIMVEMHNAVWKDTVAALPYDRRLLLLPKCLSRSGKCEGEIDEMGLLCHRCGRCKIPSLQERADELGILSMVAEGFTSVIELIENEVVDAVIGVSCLDSLEKAFPLLSSHAVPGLAIPLNHDGCHDTDVDVDYLMSLLPQRSTNDLHLLSYNRLHDTVKEWFTADKMQEMLNIDKTQGIKIYDDASRAAFEALTTDGKRWRPFLLAAMYQAMTGNTTLSDEVRRAAIAVECFHKASLVHDDIQDGDLERYGRPTVHALYGEAIAINVGDLLLGWGYKLLAECPHRELVSTIASAHISLCKGQGTELAWTAVRANEKPTLSLDFVLDIFANKTVPAFEMALLLGLICADRKDEKEALSTYSRHLGIAYQLNDDIEDCLQDDGEQRRPSAILALLSEHKEWTREEAIEEVRRLVEHHHQLALNTLGKVDCLELKRLLFQVTEKILGN